MTQQLSAGIGTCSLVTKMILWESCVKLAESDVNTEYEADAHATDLKTSELEKEQKCSFAAFPVTERIPCRREGTIPDSST